MTDHINGESSLLKEAALAHFVGRQLGSGAYRRVYALKHDRTKVMKIEYCGNDFCNIDEMKVWQEVEHTPIEKWFAPCYEIENLGIALIQARTTPFECKDDFDAEVAKLPDGALPAFFDDVHFGNFGMLDGRIVCHDYGFHHFLKWGVKGAWLAQQDREEAEAKAAGKQMDLPLC